MSVVQTIFILVFFIMPHVLRFILPFFDSVTLSVVVMLTLTDLISAGRPGLSVGALWEHRPCIAIILRNQAGMMTLADLPSCSHDRLKSRHVLASLYRHDFLLQHTFVLEVGWAEVLCVE